VTVALDVDPADARPFIEAAAPAHPSLIDSAHVVDELFGVVNVPNGVWIDESGTIVRPAEPAFPGRNPAQEWMDKLDPDTLPPETAEILREAKKIKTDPEAYKAALLDWVEHGAASRFALSPDEVVRRSGERDTARAEAAAHFELGRHLHDHGDVPGAQRHWREAHRLQPENWTYKRQAWNLVSPIVQGPNDVYDGHWFADVKKIGAENYYPPFVP
jgi:hypothetical protein